MQVTKIEKKGKYQYLVFLDEEYAFWLSYKEIYHWHLKEGVEIDEEKYKSIIKESVIPRCKRKAISYLKRCNQTEYELRTKLKKHDYLTPVIDVTIAYLYQCMYLDDYRYAELFVENNKRSRSQKWMKLKLSQKGISKDVIEELLAENTSEEIPLRKAIEKKLKGKRIEERKDKEKILAYLFRQGFSMQLSKRLLNEYE